MDSRCAIAAWLECFQEKPSWFRNKQVCQGRISVKRFERSNGLDTALYKTYLYIRLAMEMLQNGIRIVPLKQIVCNASDMMRSCEFTIHCDS